MAAIITATIMLTCHPMACDAYAQYAQPTWANERLILEMASILQGEAGDAPEALDFVAEQIVRDADLGINLRRRWYAWRQPKPETVVHIRQALERLVNDNLIYPKCQYIGSASDTAHWGYTIYQADQWFPADRPKVFGFNCK